VIRYSISPADQENRIEVHRPGWLDRSRKKLAEILKKSKHRFPALWSEIKDVYIILQESKCAFCERRLEGLPHGRVDQDVEHFRPKGNVKPWKVSTALVAAGVTLAQPAGSKAEPGYAHLAYHPLNYAMACKPCNSTLKRDYFPIAGSRQSSGKDPSMFAGERAYLIYPIGNVDEKPEDLIEFYGLSPRPRLKKGHGKLRGLVTIDFFKLDTGKTRAVRKTLMRGRAELIEKLVFALRLKAKATSSAERKQYQEAIDRSTTPSSEHTNCLRSFVRLYESNHAERETVYAGIMKYLDSVSN
jgi:hypothetical protein